MTSIEKRFPLEGMRIVLYALLFLCLAAVTYNTIGKAAESTYEAERLAGTLGVIAAIALAILIYLILTGSIRTNETHASQVEQLRLSSRINQHQDGLSALGVDSHFSYSSPLLIRILKSITGAVSIFISALFLGAILNSIFKGEVRDEKWGELFFFLFTMPLFLTYILLTIRRRSPLKELQATELALSQKLEIEQLKRNIG